MHSVRTLGATAALADTDVLEPDEDSSQYGVVIGSWHPVT